MKKSLILLIALAFTGCQGDYRKSDLTGREVWWQCISSYNQGVRAFNSGVPAADNPFRSTPGSGIFGGNLPQEQAKWWLEGWIDGKTAKEGTK